jgi:TM2 domain-containing membrane protein YozV
MNRMNGLFFSIGTFIAGMHQMTIAGGVGNLIFLLLFMVGPICFVSVCIFVTYIMIERNERIEKQGRGN